MSSANFKRKRTAAASRSFLARARLFFLYLYILICELWHDRHSLLAYFVPIRRIGIRRIGIRRNGIRRNGVEPFGALKPGFWSLATLKLIMNVVGELQTEKNSCGIAQFPCDSTAFLFASTPQRLQPFQNLQSGVEFRCAAHCHVTCDAVDNEFGYFCSKVHDWRELLATLTTSDVKRYPVNDISFVQIDIRISNCHSAYRISKMLV